MDNRIRKYSKALCCIAILVSLIALAFLTSCGAKDKNEVRVYSYGDYVDPQVVKDFQKETGIEVILDTYDTNEEMYPVIKNRAGVYDVICPDAYMVQQMSEEGLLSEIDKSKLPNYKNIGKRYLDMAENYDPGNKYAVPYQWGYTVIMYDKARVPEGSVDSWNDLWDKKYQGKIVMMNSMRDTFAIALKADGNSINTLSEAELKKACDRLIAQKPLVYRYANDSARDSLIGGAAEIGTVWNGEIIYSTGLNKKLSYVIPKEGTEVFVDNWCIPKNAFHKSNAEKWIDYMCRPDVAYKNYEYLGYSTPNEGARALMSKPERNDPALFASDEVLKKSETLKALDRKGKRLYGDYWKIFRSAD
ncbi:MAG: spermidine/putrescine ABC transporter substrate-binding protein [Eubacteriales bacterium]|nr:spermidine/putrescine ABC transporter substrate-binding protein [Eubacteriales bacterium]